MTSDLNVGLPLALTMGDPTGIGPDLTVSAWLKRKELGLPPFFVLGPRQVFLDRSRVLGVGGFTLSLIDRPEDAMRVFDHALPVLDGGPVLPEAVPGQPHAAFAPAIIRSIRDAVRFTLEGRCGAVVTNPIAKNILMETGFAHAGHTEFLGELASAALGQTVHPVMLMASDLIKTVPLTVHIPLGAVPGEINGSLIGKTVEVLAGGLTRFFGLPEPRIAVCGLNPHAGEAGEIGREEISVIAPAIAALRERGYSISGPYPADTLFHAEARKSYDAALAMYHDQALIPFKMLSFDDGVNVTLGLPFIRTSPDHGTAFSLAGTGKASARSLVAALRLADTMARRDAGRAAS